VTTTFHGVSVTDDYQWLERADDPQVTAWVAAQNVATRAALDPLPGRAALEARVRALANNPSPEYFDLERRGGRWFALKSTPPKQHPSLIVMAAPDEAKSEHVVVDPDAIDPTHATAIDWFQPSLDGRRVAVSLSLNGSERGSLHVFDVESKKA